ncbi:lysophospholipid acyltransferase family protein [Pelagibacterales bacterium SAG-MED39]|nr:lysophospholipid acyltransferase family protein [Pelagibacterales bacterium SAG-MED39]
MKQIKYFLQFLGIIFLFITFKVIGLRLSRIFSGYLLGSLGPLFRSKKIIHSNLSTALPEISEVEKKKIIKKMWFNYGQILAEYMFIKDFRNNSNYSKNIVIENLDELQKIGLDSKPVIFISGHFNNFELMAMQIEKLGIDLAAVYRPLNNFFLNIIMEKIRKKHICKKQVKKGVSGTKKLLEYFKNGTSIALMIDQRVSQGIRCNFFNKEALTTTIPAQFVKKYQAKIIPVYIERSKNNFFKLNFHKAIEFSDDEDIESITLKLNNVLENMIIENPDQWIWSHNRWK